MEVYPGHVAGSLCGKAMSSKASTTVGFERRFNPALAHDDVALFVAESAGASTPRPPNMQRIVELNRGPFVGAQPEPEELAVPPDAAQVLDVRPVGRFADGHLPGALSVPVSGTRFSTKAAFVLDGGPVVVAASSEQEAAEAIRGLRSVGILDLAGYVLGGGTEQLERRRHRAARRAPRGRRGAHRRPREGGARHRLHRREPQHPVPAARARRGRSSTRPSDRHDLRDGAARRHRREHPLGPRLRRAPGRGRRHRLVGRGGTADGRVQALRRLTATPEAGRRARLRARRRGASRAARGSAPRRAWRRRARSRSAAPSSCAPHGGDRRRRRCPAPRR